MVVLLVGVEVLLEGGEEVEVHLVGVGEEEEGEEGRQHLQGGEEEGVGVGVVHQRAVRALQMQLIQEK